MKQELTRKRAEFNEIYILTRYNKQFVNNMKNLNPLLIFLIPAAMLNSCGPQDLNIKKEQKAETVIDTSLIAILPFNAETSFIYKNGRPAQLNTEDILAIEHILSESIDKYNSEQEGEMKRIAENYKNSEVNRDDFIIDLKKYKRQYITYFNIEGEKEVWVNCFCSPPGPYWRKELFLVDDGGNCYFNITINLTTKRPADLSANGVA